ncbi:hypothetical protein J2Z83_001240 [Virgibacillus natechei]|uniref:YfhD family protein n=1 Tax=Virgibacillus natechei TaxID=1216297 RepID=A0ABS4IDX0_9BACI|nr:hypothetical protein [Virgibacillus natechei]MBP1969137.1 hypothetical protein [Virgibacillus natechei]UZD14399.1 hypothetical protein OLD84_07830 [Virgibacillus natechei]
MDKKKRTQPAESVVAPGMDPEDSYGERATKSDIRKKESTRVTRLLNDEYDPNDK